MTIECIFSVAILCSVLCSALSCARQARDAGAGAAPATQDSACRKTGCSGEICSDKDISSTCEAKEEFACYKDAECIRQASGSCAFTPTPELLGCVAKAQKDAKNSEVQ